MLHSSQPAMPSLAPGSDGGVRVVAIGGGTGLSTLLKGLKKYVASASRRLPFSEFQADTWPSSQPDRTPRISELSAVVTVSDDGGSSGRLRKDFNMLPPGDIRNCIVALSEDEAMLSRLFQHRFEKGSGLEGHSFGNLFLAALTSITGDFSEAVRLSSEILATRGRIYPATDANVELEALMEDGTRVRGESQITASKGRIRELCLIPKNVNPLPETLDAIARADVITIGPGSLFTSLIPNLLVRGIAEAIASSPAKKVYICNLMTQANESLGRTAADHIRALNEHAGRNVFDYALINQTPPSATLRARYAREGAAEVVADLAVLESMGVHAILGDYMMEEEVARHNTDKLAKDLLGLSNLEDRTC
jgi:uncharacterized cofD-like protein